MQQSTYFLSCLINRYVLFFLSLSSLLCWIVLTLHFIFNSFHVRVMRTQHKAKAFSRPLFRSRQLHVNRRFPIFHVYTICHMTLYTHRLVSICTVKSIDGQSIFLGSHCLLLYLAYLMFTIAYVVTYDVQINFKSIECERFCASLRLSLSLSSFVGVCACCFHFFTFGCHISIQ